MSDKIETTLRISITPDFDTYLIKVKRKDGKISSIMVSYK